MLIVSKKSGGRIRYAAEKLLPTGVRVLVVRKDYEDGTVRDEMTQMPQSDRPLFFAPNLADDLDDSAVRDMVQSFYGRRAARRVARPDVTALYHEYNEMRAAAFKGQRQFAASTKSED